MPSTTSSASSIATIHKLQHGTGLGRARVRGALSWARSAASAPSTPLVEVMRNTREEDRDVRMAASRALGRIRDPRALEPLLEALAAPESWLPARVAEVVLEFGDAGVRAAA